MGEKSEDQSIFGGRFSGVQSDIISRQVKDLFVFPQIKTKVFSKDGERKEKQ